MLLKTFFNTVLFDFLNILLRIFGTLNKTEMEFVAAIWWVYVACMEEIHLGGEKTRPHVFMFSAAKAKVVIDAYQKVQVKRQMSQRSTEGRKLQEWTPPPSNCIKVKS